MKLKLRSFILPVAVIAGLLAWAPSPAAAQTCDSTISCHLSVSCTNNDCKVNETATFTLVCDYERLEPCSEIEQQRCCFPVLEVPDPVWYEGERLINGVWVTDADCLQAPNPLTHTFSSDDVGTYRRSACRDSGCNICSPVETITVSE